MHQNRVLVDVGPADHAQFAQAVRVNRRLAYAHSGGRLRDLLFTGIRKKDALAYYTLACTRKQACPCVLLLVAKSVLRLE